MRGRERHTKKRRSSGLFGRSHKCIGKRRCYAGKKLYRRTLKGGKKKKGIEGKVIRVKVAGWSFTWRQIIVEGEFFKGGSEKHEERKVVRVKVAGWRLTCGVSALPRLGPSCSG